MHRLNDRYNTHELPTYVFYRLNRKRSAIVLQRPCILNDDDTIKKYLPTLNTIITHTICIYIYCILLSRVSFVAHQRYLQCSSYTTAMCIVFFRVKYYLQIHAVYTYLRIPRVFILFRSVTVGLSRKLKIADFLILSAISRRVRKYNGKLNFFFAYNSMYHCRHVIMVIYIFYVKILRYTRFEVGYAFSDGRKRILWFRVRVMLPFYFLFNIIAGITRY